MSCQVALGLKTRAEHQIGTHAPKGQLRQAVGELAPLDGSARRIDLGEHVVDWGNVPSWVSAGVAVFALVSAGFAAYFAYHQLDLARSLREEKARPFVVVDIVPVQHPFTELVIQNVGETLAKDVRVFFDPPLVTTLDNDEMAIASSFALKEGIPSLPPGREHRMLFENMPDRYAREDLPRRYEVTVTSSGRRGPEEPLVQVLDLNVFYGYHRLEQYGVHHVAKTLRAWAKKDGVKSF
jgi:hypothetical protein